MLLNGLLYKKSYSFPLLKCLRLTKADHVLREIHESIYKKHLGGMSLAYRSLWQGYYRFTMQEDTIELIEKCDICQWHPTSNGSWQVS